MRRRLAAFALASLVLSTCFAAGSGRSGANFTAAVARPASSFSAAGDWVAPVVTIGTPADGARLASSKPSFSGTAGTVSGDLASLTVRIYSGTTTGGTPAQALTTTATGSAWAVAPSIALPDGVYTVQASQSDAGITDVITFTYSEPVAPATVLAGFTLQRASTRVSFVWTATGSGLTTTAPPPVVEDHVEPSEAPGHLKLRVYVRRTQPARRPQVYVNVYCSDRCTLTATGDVSVPSRKAHWTTKPLKGGVTRAGTVEFRLPLSEKALEL
ncbi:MAG: hypothetical protein M3P44_03890 [Actinomycetota bacterium]|nr:hypothetical protein [Actinomycetota bacterium]